jgi:hypothetical protein
MGDPQIPTEIQTQTVTSVVETGHSNLFSTPPQEPSSRGKIIGVAIAVAVLVVIALALFLRGGKNAPPVAQNAVLPADTYAPNLTFTDLAMSESTSLSGGKSTFIDGHVRNTGGATLTGVTMQVLFRNDVGLSPQVETLPLTLIRTHEPYVDTEPVSAAPLKPGDQAEFRLIIETVNANWNQQMPELVVIRVAKR